jgi:hypothetical protein
VGSKYEHLNREELIRLLEARDRRARFGLVWEADEIERDRALNSDFVALDLVPELSCGASLWRNLIIEGDNFDALRHLRMAFAGQVKCIYIDPPYNTGNRDFVYNDRFVDKEDSWRHSKWCEFMFQRLMIARDLLTPDGAIVVSIDDNEVFSLGMLMNRVFGEGAHVATCIWQKRYSRENREAIGDAHEYLLFYSPNPERFKAVRGMIPMTEKQERFTKIQTTIRVGAGDPFRCQHKATGQTRCMKSLRQAEKFIVHLKVHVGRCSNPNINGCLPKAGFISGRMEAPHRDASAISMKSKASFLGHGGRTKKSDTPTRHGTRCASFSERKPRSTRQSQCD